jgi:hypothetical protein
MVVAFLTLLGARLYVNHPTTGDEPHYLIMDYSLKVDKDLDLKNNYENNDHLRYSQEYSYPHVSHLNINSTSSGWYSFHGVGLPILLFPAFLISEKTGPAIFMVLIAALVVGLTMNWAYVVTNNKKASLLAGVALLSCYFFNGLAGYLYPDLVIALLALVSFIILATNLHHRRRYQLLLGTALGAMVFMHFRTLVLVLPLALTFLLLHWKKHGFKVPWSFLIPSLLLAVTFFVTLHAWFGVWEPNAIYASMVSVGIKNLVNTPAILFDSLRGGFVYNPILYILPVGLPIWFRYSRRTFYLLITLLPIIYLTFAFNEWHGGYSPSGRYLMGFIPVLIPAISMFYLYAKSWLNRLVWYFLLSATFLISIIATLIKQPYMGYSLRSEIFVTLQKFAKVGFDKVFPTYYFINTSIMDKYGVVQASFWMGVLVLSVAYGVVLARRRADQPIGARVKNV